MKKIGLLVALMPLMINIAFALEIKLPITSEYTDRNEYQISLLKLILNKTGVSYKIKSSSTKYSQARIIEMLKSGRKINLYWMGTSKNLEKTLLPIRYPIDRGLLGYRIFIIHKDHQNKFDKIQTLTDLQKLRGVQGIGWSDITILENSGLKQHKNLYENIFKMVHYGGRVDYFSRGVSEAFTEVAARKIELSNLAIDKNILLVYPFTMFFFTNRSNLELARVLERGFQNAYEDGSFLKFFYNHPKITAVFNKAGLKHRVRIDIPNPLLTPETAAIPNKYWHGKE